MCWTQAILVDSLAQQAHVINYDAGDVLQQSGSHVEMFGVVMHGSLEEKDKAGNVKPLGQYDAFGIASLDVSHDDTVVSGVTIAAAGPCSVAVVKRDPVMLENMRAQQHHAQPVVVRNVIAERSRDR